MTSPSTAQTATRFDVVVVGGGHAGAQVAISLRQLGFAGSIAIVGEEEDPPYERPPLSKDYLSGARPFARLLLRPPAFWAERGVALLLGQRVIALDPGRHELRTATRSTIGYDVLVWAAGGSPRRLTCSGHDVAGVHTLRTRADVDRLLAELPGTSRVAVVGGGYLGLESAAVLTTLGKQVILIEAQPRLLARVAAAPLSRFYEAEHRARGVDIRLGATIACIEEEGGRATGVRLATGELLPAEMVIVAVGIVPAVAPLLAAGAAGADGVLVDAACRTTIPDVYAIGDCALHANRFAGGATIRLESIQNANDQAAVAARAIMGAEAAYDAVPWFWSHQYDLRLQTVGLLAGHDQVVLRGQPAQRSFSLVYLKQGRVMALDCVNAMRDYAQGRALVLAGQRVDPDRLADPGTPLKALADAG